MMENDGKIKSRYQEIGKILKEVYNIFADDKIFSPDKLIKFTDGPEKGQYGWDLSICPEIERIVKTSQERLMLALEMTGGRGKMVDQDLAERCRKWVEEYCGVNQDNAIKTTPRIYNSTNQTIHQPYQNNTNNRQNMSIPNMIINRIMFVASNEQIREVSEEFTKDRTIGWRRLLEKLHIYYFD